MNKITILGDSTTLPRPQDGVTIDDTYPLLLAEHAVVLNKSAISADTDYFLESRQLHYDIKYANSEYFVLNLGICDCSPRIFTKREKKLIDLLLDFKATNCLARYYLNRLSQNRLHHTKKRQIVNVQLNRFEQNIREIIKTISDSNPIKTIFIVNVLDPSAELDARSYGLKNLVSQYNQVLSDIANSSDTLVKIVDIYSFTKEKPETITPDGHHFKKEGHAFVYNEISKQLTA